MRASKRIISKLAILVAVLLCPLASDGITTIIESDGSEFTGVDSVNTGQGEMTGWLTTESLQDASVSAWLYARYPTITGEAYLTTTIGPGTTTANQIAAVSFSFPTTGSLVNLFSGLQLPPGQYYLSIIGTSAGVNGYAGGWDIGTGTATSDPNTTYSGTIFESTAPNAYFPSTPNSVGGAGVQDLGFIVQGTVVSVPEPDLYSLLLIGVFALTIQRRVFRSGYTRGAMASGN